MRNGCEARRILMTADAMGGVWTFTVDLARCFQRQGIELLIALMGDPPTAAQRRELDDLGNVVVCESDYRLEWMDDPWRDVDHASEWLLGLAHQFQPDLVHLNGYAHAALSWEAPVVLTAHSCVCTWW